MKSTTKLRQLLERPGMRIVPGAHDAMSARLVEAEGFDAVTLAALPLRLARLAFQVIR
jgi:2-methylisocitrate lyase-like PEP mutase family enzyme